MTPNPSIERTSQGLRPCPAAHVERYVFFRQFRLPGIERALLFACETPQRFPAVLKDVQRVRVKRFPYFVSSEFVEIALSFSRCSMCVAIQPSGVSEHKHALQAPTFNFFLRPEP